MISFYPEGVQPDAQCLENGTIYNDDGHGYAILYDGRFITGHFVGINGGTEAIEEFVQMRKVFPKGPAMFHSRMTTHGANTLENCHPFYIGGQNGHKDTMIAHNGILPAFSQPGKNDIRSDTRIFAEDIVPELGVHFNLWSKKGRKRICKWMGSYNKIVMMTTRPYVGNRWFILNEDHGIWHNGIWYSNSSFRDVRTYRYSFGSYQGIPTTLGPRPDTDWAHYTTGDAGGVTKCNACFSYETIDITTGVCRFCHMCNDCGELDTCCLCYTPAKLDNRAAESQMIHSATGWPEPEVQNESGVCYEA